MAHEVSEFSRGDIVLVKELYHGKEFLADLSNMLSQICRASNIEYQSQCDFDGAINMDGERIRRVLLNLATNACDAMTQKQTIHAKLVVSIIRENEDIVFACEDNGPGISESIQANLFEPFVTHGKKNGTGLGMAIAKKMVDAHKGKISFETSSQGTTFTLRLPDAYEEHSIQDTESEEEFLHTNLGALKVLVAEDDLVNQKIVAKLLEKLMVQVNVVSNGVEAIEQLKREYFDVVLMDLEMPEMGGIQATQYIRQELSNDSIPIIALTGHSGEEELQKCRSAGMDDVLQKPIDRRRLAEALQRSVSNSKKYPSYSMNDLGTNNCSI